MGLAKKPVSIMIILFNLIMVMVIMHKSCEARQLGEMKAAQFDDAHNAVNLPSLDKYGATTQQLNGYGADRQIDQSLTIPFYRRPGQPDKLYTQMHQVPESSYLMQHFEQPDERYTQSLQIPESSHGLVPSP
ncbi:hypothetical protein Salat_1133500 [Sesamum alatum]|uniref:Uncharacterized protein n=1 Tax=Sesamum alatum TaxID=300844 RepID=A0AAE1YE07_9LAMI|nr:hypothetical protein Salat_1133500 [Sesamum alatum]